MPARITFKVDKEGKVHIDVSGVDDASCADITAVFEQALGLVEDVQRKPAYYNELDGTQLYATEEE